MGRLINIRWPELDVQVVAELADERNPELCEEFWRHLPFAVLQAHPVVSGESLYAWAPMVSTAPVVWRERIDRCPPGCLRYSQQTGNKFSIQYGQGREPLAQPVLGQVLPEYLHRLPTVGRAIWDNLFWRKELVFVEVSAHDALAARAPLPDWQEQPEPIPTFMREAKRIQTSEPEELRDIRLGRVRDTGTFGQYFSAWDFAQNMLRDYINYTMYVILRLADQQDVATLRQTIEAIDPPYTSYLGVVGLKTLEQFSGLMRTAIASAHSRDEVKAILTAYLQYGNRLVAWAYHYFPWHLGVFYNRQIDGQEFPGRFQPYRPDAERAA